MKELKDSELAAIAAELRRTACYALPPLFKEKLREQCLYLFRAAMQVKEESDGSQRK